MEKNPTKEEVLQALVDMWYQFGYEGSSGNHLWAGGLSALERTEAVLRQSGLLNRNGVLKKEFRKRFGY